MKIRSILISALLVAFMSIGLFAQMRPSTPAPSSQRRPQAQQQNPDTAVIYMKADNAYTYKIDTATVWCFVGNFAAQHQGSIITADSAVRYNDMYVECFGNVLINKGTTYIYGERADYDGNISQARVYSELVKMVDTDAVLYTYHFSFDTENNVGRFYGGGTVTNRDNRLESQRGYYFADFREIICVEEVEIHTEDYEMKGDSVVYNIDTDHAEYFTNSNIWNTNDDYLYADRGEYIKEGELYRVTDNGYILTERQEVWSDSIDYFRAEEHAKLFHNIQFDDLDHKTLAFGNYGEYWGNEGNAFLTRNPVVVNYDTSQGDTLFMRSDSMYLFTINTAAERREAERRKADSLAQIEAEKSLAESAIEQDDNKGSMEIAADSMSSRRGAMRGGKGRQQGADSERTGRGNRQLREGADSTSSHNADRGEMMSHDSAQHPDDEVEELLDSLSSTSLSTDSLAVDSLAADSVMVLTPKEIKAQKKQEAQKLKELKRKEAEQERKAKLDTIAAERLRKLQALKVKDEAAAAARAERSAALMQKRTERENARRAKRGLPPLAVDSTATDSLSRDGMLQADSLTITLPDSLAPDSLAIDSLALARDSIDADSVYRLVKCFRNVKIYRSDFQALCDSLTAMTSDSTIHMYLSPVLWNTNNQVTSEVMDIYTAGSMITRAEFVGKPIMAAEIDTICYNQVTGKSMTAHFRDGAIYRDDVNGNAQTIYYTQDSHTGEVTEMMYIESGGASFYINGQTLERITYQGNPTGILYPIGQVPESQMVRLPDFEWRGAERPTRHGVFDLEIRPSRREEIRSLSRPTFPISEQIERRKRNLMESGTWLDRVDVLSPEDEEFLRDPLATPIN